jgi:hypothetical protein
MGEDVAAAGGDGLDGMAAEDPVADVDDVDVLLEEDVAGEHAVPEPVAKADFIGGHARPGVVYGCRRVVVGGDAGELAERAGVDAVDDLDEGRRAADLETDIDTGLAVDALGDLKGFAGLRDIDADRLFAVGMLAAGNRGFEVLDVEVWRRRDLDGVDVFRGCELFKGAIAVKGELRVDGGNIE